jgi:uncharacterized protein (TIGR02996 family)
MDEEALLANMRKNPDDHLPYLVYADWLEEHGRLDEAELIRVSITVSRSAHYQFVGQPKPRYRRRFLTYTLNSSLPQSDNKIYYLRRYGVVETIRTYKFSAEDIPLVMEALERNRSCQSLELHFSDCNVRSLRQLRTLSNRILSSLLSESKKRHKCPLRRVKTLSMNKFLSNLTQEAHAKWLELFPELEDLTIEFQPFKDTENELLLELKQATFQSTLKSVNLHGPLNEKVVDDLIAWPCLPNLECLSIRDDQLEYFEMQTILNAPLHRVKKIAIRSNQLTDESLEFVPDKIKAIQHCSIWSEHISLITRLRFRASVIARNSSCQFLWSEDFSRDSIDYLRNTLAPGQIKDLSIKVKEGVLVDWGSIFDSAFLNQLETLSFDSHSQTPDLGWLAQHPHIAKLKELDLWEASYDAAMSFYRLHPLGDSIRFSFGTYSWTSQEIVQYLDNFANRIISCPIESGSVVFLGNYRVTAEEADQIHAAIFRNHDQFPFDLDYIGSSAHISDEFLGRLPLIPNFLQSDIHINFTLKNVTLSGLANFLQHPELVDWNQNSNILGHFANDPEGKAMIEACPYIRLPIIDLN